MAALTNDPKVTTFTIVVERPDEQTPWGIDFRTFNDVNGDLVQVVAAPPTSVAAGRLRDQDVNGATAPSGHSDMLNLLRKSTRLVFRVARGVELSKVVIQNQAEELKAQLAMPKGKHRFRTIATLVKLGAAMHFGEKKVVQREGKVKASEVVIGKKRKKGDHGFRFETLPDGRHRITEVDKSAAVGKTHMSVGDYLARINGVATKGKSHSDIKALLKTARKKELSIEIERSFDAVHVEELDVELTRVGGGGLGLVLGSSHFDEHTVVRVAEGSPAEGKIHPDDIIEAVNGVKTDGMDHDALIVELGKLNPTVLKIHRWLKDSDGDHTNAKTRFVELHLPAGDDSYGFTFQSFGTGDHRVVEILPNSPADGKLGQMDKILTVNGHRAVNMAHGEVIELLSKTGGVLTMDIEEGSTRMVENLEPLTPNTPAKAENTPDTPQTPVPSSPRTPATVSLNSSRADSALSEPVLEGFKFTGRGKVNIQEVRPGHVILFC